MIKKIFIGGVVFCFCMSFFFCSAVSVFAANVTWHETQPAGDIDQNWTGVKMSWDGKVMLAGENNGRLYVSRDAGSTWEEVQPAGDNDNGWLVTGVSRDGQRMIAGAYGGRLYISYDAGKTWTDSMAAGDADSSWQGGAISGDGNIIIAGVNPGRLYISKNGGTTWSETRPAGAIDKNWIPMAISTNNHIILAGVYGGRLYRSTDQGSSWSEIKPAGGSDFNWNTVGTDINGQTMLAGIDDAGDEDTPRAGNVYLSKDGGNSWSEQVIAGTYGREWRISSLSDDGRTMFVGYGTSETDGRLFLSSNMGSTWIETQPAGNIDRLWNAGVVSNEGYTFIVGAGTDSGIRRLYVGTLPRPVATSSQSSSSNSNTNPCPGFVVCPNVESSSSTTQVVSTGGAGGGAMTINPDPGSMALSVTSSVPSIASLLSDDSPVPVPWSQGYNIAGDVFSFTAVSAFNGYPVTTLDHPATIMLHFDPAKLAGHSVKDLRIGWYNPVTKKWQLLNANTVVKPGENLIANTTTKFGYYTVLFVNGSGGYSPVLGAQTHADGGDLQKSVLPSAEPTQERVVTVVPTRVPVVPVAKKPSKTCFLFVCW